MLGGYLALEQEKADLHANMHELEGAIVQLRGQERRLRDEDMQMEQEI